MDTVERVKGIEPSSEAWEAPALPLSYTPMTCLVTLYECGAKSYLKNKYWTYTICFLIIPILWDFLEYIWQLRTRIKRKIQ